MLLRPGRLPNFFLPSRLLGIRRFPQVKPTRLHYSVNNGPTATPVGTQQPVKATAVSPQKSVQAIAFAQRGRVPNKYPERLLIFHSPSVVTSFTGMNKLVTIVLFGVGGCLIAAPAVYFNPESPWWMTPAVIVVAAVPMAVVSLMTAPFVAEVFIRLPEWARKSKDTLNKFARRLPPDTRLDIQKMGFLPLPRTRSLQLSELRSRSGLYLANLEHVPSKPREKELPGWLRFAKNYLYTRPNPSHWAKTAAPEVWPLVLDHVKRNTIATASSTSTAMKDDVTSMKDARTLPGPATAMPRARGTRTLARGRK